MLSVKKNYAFVLKSIKKDSTLKPINTTLKDKTFIIGGGTRGIGFNIAKKLAMKGANVTIIGKTQSKHPKLEGTIYSSAEKICNLVKRPAVLGIPCDLRVPKQMDHVINENIGCFLVLLMVLF